MDEKAEVMGARKGLTEEQKMRHAVRGMFFPPLPQPSP